MEIDSPFMEIDSSGPDSTMPGRYLGSRLAESEG
jgi:hypothetical protein